MPRRFKPPRRFEAEQATANDNGTAAAPRRRDHRLGISHVAKRPHVGQANAWNRWRKRL